MDYLLVRISKKKSTEIRIKNKLKFWSSHVAASSLWPAQGFRPKKLRSSDRSAKPFGATVAATQFIS
ncbi:hypothetical protein MON38_16495 [Hymenobacter sp. DH14]|uniref:Uncharacterized protein n=1 Tax=Hymenobacter cyanobacteriorum TaxID=2926463 RepID=A0A9X2AJN0_9BACT|nr:hypothetical protein [Hymenobacter cyanobacteriorum]MCI1189024.1 hypothetical protein [Hymenobacter cyanobacteriorum]